MTARVIRFLLLVALTPCCTAAPAPADNGAVDQDFAQHRSNVEVTATGKVTRLLADESGPSGTHQRFIVALDGSSQTVLIDNNVSIGKRAPAAVGDQVVVHGAYVWNQQGGLIHFTHHDPQLTHEGGWLEHGGTRYD